MDALLQNVAQNQISRGTYAVYVQGEVEEQSALHKGIGWKSVDVGIAETEGTLDAILDKALDSFLENL